MAGVHEWSTTVPSAVAARGPALSRRDRSRRPGHSPRGQPGAGPPRARRRRRTQLLGTGPGSDGPHCGISGAATGRAGWARSTTRTGVGARPPFPPLARAHIERIACTEPAAYGRHLTRWDCRSLAEVVVEQAVVDSIYYTTVARVLRAASLRRTAAGTGRRRPLTRSSRDSPPACSGATSESSGWSGAGSSCSAWTRNRTCRRSDSGRTAARRASTSSSTAARRTSPATPGRGSPRPRGCACSTRRRTRAGSIRRSCCSAPSATATSAISTLGPAGLSITHLDASWREYNRHYAHPFAWSWTRRDLRAWAADKDLVICSQTSATVH